MASENEVFDFLLGYQDFGASLACEDEAQFGDFSPQFGLGDALSSTSTSDPFQALEQTATSASSSSFSTPQPQSPSPPLQSSSSPLHNSSSPTISHSSERPTTKKESHAAIERRRRDDINERIEELSRVLPECGQSTTKYNKATILRKGINYIKFMHSKTQKLEEEYQTLYQQSMYSTQMLDYVNRQLQLANQKIAALEAELSDKKSRKKKKETQEYMFSENQFEFHVNSAKDQTDRKLPLTTMKILMVAVTMFSYSYFPSEPSGPASMIPRALAAVQAPSFLPLGAICWWLIRAFFLILTLSSFAFSHSLASDCSNVFQKAKSMRNPSPNTVNYNSEIAILTLVGAPLPVGPFHLKLQILKQLLCNILIRLWIGKWVNHTIISQLNAHECAEMIVRINNALAIGIRNGKGRDRWLLLYLNLTSLNLSMTLSNSSLQTMSQASLFHDLLLFFQYIAPFSKILLQRKMGEATSESQGGALQMKGFHCLVSGQLRPALALFKSAASAHMQSECLTSWLECKIVRGWLCLFTGIDHGANQSLVEGTGMQDFEDILRLTETRSFNGARWWALVGLGYIAIAEGDWKRAQELLLQASQLVGDDQLTTIQRIYMMGCEAYIALLNKEVEKGWLLVRDISRMIPPQLYPYEAFGLIHIIETQLTIWEHAKRTKAFPVELSDIQETVDSSLLKLKRLASSFHGLGESAAFLEARATFLKTEDRRSYIGKLRLQVERLAQEGMESSLFEAQLQLELARFPSQAPQTSPKPKAPKPRPAKPEGDAPWLIETAAALASGAPATDKLALLWKALDSLPRSQPPVPSSSASQPLPSM